MQLHLSNLIGQYHQNGSQPTEAVKGVKGVENLTSTIRGMGKGNIFEGTVSSVRGSKVTLALSNGQELSARLDGKVSIQEGQSMFFQVKSNDGVTIQIRPFLVDGETANLTLINALKAAGLAADAKNLSMVNTMMQEQMSIDAKSMNHMARAALQNPDIEISTLVQMQKLGITLSPENASQFENYQNDAKTISDELFSLIDSMPEAMSDESIPFETLKEMDSQVLSVITENLPEDAFLESSLVIDTLTEELQEAGLLEQEKEAEVSLELGGKEVLPEHAINQLLSQEELTSLGESLKLIPGMKEQPLLFLGEELNPKATSADVLKSLEEVLKTDMKPIVNPEKEALVKELTEQGFEGQALEEELIKSGFTPEKQLEGTELENMVRHIFSGKTMKTLVKDVLEQQWLLKPEDVAKENSVKKLYERLDSQIKQMEEIVKATGQSRSSFSENAQDIRNNIQFMNEINQAYTYVQIPLKMNGQNANGQLYVYTNKKALVEGEKDLTAFLHLDMDHLGPTDVSVRLHNKEVSTNFYMENDAAYKLLEEHMDELETRLAKKGYHAKISIVNESNSVNFVEDFLKRDRPSAGTLRRYSFDMRA